MRDHGAKELARLEREHGYLQLLVRAGEVLGEAIDWRQTIGNVCVAAVETVADICLLDLGHGRDVHLAAAVHKDPARTSELRGAGAFLHGATRAAKHPVCSVIESGRALLVSDIDDTYLATESTSPEHEQFMRDLGYRSMMIVPLASMTSGTLGALTLVQTDPQRAPYDAEDLRFAWDLARRCANAIAKARLYDRTLHIATEYQRASLPTRLPEHESIAFDAFYEPSSEELLVGGDWYDAFDLPDGRIAVTIGDVLGHGIAAAVWMSTMRNGLRAALFTEADPARALEIADHLVRAERSEAFTTAMVALIDPHHRTLSCASAGHPGPLIWDGSGDVIDPFRERGLPLGLRDLAPVVRTAQTLPIRSGAFAAFFTDGLLEWNRDAEAGMARLCAAIARSELRDAEHPAQAVRDFVLDGEKHGDDIALLTVHWNGGEEVPRTSPR